MAIRFFLLIILLSIFPCQSATSSRALTAMRQSFLQAEKYIKQNREDDYFTLSDTLKDYPLYPYLHYQWLATHLDDDVAVLRYLHEYPQTRYAALLHNKWLTKLGKDQNWLTFVKHYSNSDSQALRCYYAQAQYHMGQQHLALETAKELWLSGKPQASSCDVLFDWLITSTDFDQQWVWQRFEAALSFNNPLLAREILPQLPKAERKTAELWLKLHNRPEQIRASSKWKRHRPKAGLMLAHAIKRWSDSNVHAALKVWDAQKNRFTIPKDVVADTEKRLAMELAFKRDKKAYPRLVKFAGNDPSAQEWRVRAALARQNWHDVLAAVDMLESNLQQQEKWQYWRARALAATGKANDAQAIFTKLATQRSFYGFIAADHTHSEIALNDHSIDATTEELDTLQTGSEFQAVRELLAIDRRAEATRQWWHAISELDAKQLTVAAKLAQQWQWPSMAIFTVAKADDWDDVDLRFPLIYSALIQNYADQQQLDPALIYGLIRQESAFDDFAGSAAGAIGLMQLMPSTAKQIAQELKQAWNNDFNLLNPAFNIKYGSTYFKKVLTDFNGHYPLAIAAYNAGPYRVKQWLPKKALPADIWIETLPYKETRGYVSSVIMYTLIYQKRLSRNTLKISDLMLEVEPG